MRYEKHDIGGKDVYIVEAHHHVLRAWAQIRRGLNAAPVLVTLDFHTDTYEPFLRYRHEATGAATFSREDDAMDAMLPDLIAAIDHNDDRSIEDAVTKLCNDEHIRTAIEAGIVSQAFVIALSETDAYPDEGGVYVAGQICALGCTKTTHTDDCASDHAAQVLESAYLDHELRVLNSMAMDDGFPAVEDQPYVLDIDLDYFRSEKAIEPDDTITFYRLVRNAVAVTVATEHEYVEECRLEGSEVTGTSLLVRMKRHIEAAMGCKV